MLRLLRSLDHGEGFEIKEQGQGSDHLDHSDHGEGLEEIQEWIREEDRTNADDMII